MCETKCIKVRTVEKEFYMLIFFFLMECSVVASLHELSVNGLQLRSQHRCLSPLPYFSPPLQPPLDLFLRQMTCFTDWFN
jgi:hypothetical protein